MPRLTEATAAKRRLHILQAAAQCLYEHGFAETSVDDVCAEAGISKGAFYSHFPSKEALIHGVMALRQSELGAIDATSIAALADSVFERQMTPAMNRRNARFGLEVMHAGITDEVLRQGLMRDLTRVRTHVSAAIETLKAHGLARSDADSDRIAAIVEAYLLGVLMRNAVWNMDGDPAVRGHLRLLLESLLAPE